MELLFLLELIMGILHEIWKGIWRGVRRSFDTEQKGPCNTCKYVLKIILAVFLLFGATGQTIYWILFYGQGYGWADDIPEKQFNLHPTLMVAGFVTLSGFSVLLYRIFHGFRHIYVKRLHAIFHTLAVPCIIIGFMATFDYHNRESITHFYSLHSWIGLVAMGLFGLQYVIGLISFLLLLIWSEDTAKFRASLVPFHAAFGILTFVLGVVACLTGLTQKALIQFGHPTSWQKYTDLPPEAITVNEIGLTIVAAAIIVLYALRGTGGYLRSKSQHPG